MSDGLPPVAVINSNRTKKNEVTSIIQAGECMFHVKSRFCGPHQYKDQLLTILKRNIAAEQ